MTSEVQYVSYSNVQRDLVHRGYDTVAEVLLGSDEEAKLSLLFCLEYYVDSYFGAKLDYEKELCDLLQRMYLTERSVKLIRGVEDVLQYYQGDLEILRNHYDQIPEDCRFGYRMNMLSPGKEAFETVASGFSAVCQGLENWDYRARIDLLVALQRYVDEQRHGCDDYFDSKTVPAYTDELIPVLKQMYEASDDIQIRDFISDILDA